MVENAILEKNRLLLQSRLDALKTHTERNRLGQFATPTILAEEIIQFGLNLLKKDIPIRFLDPAIGTGSFYSALVRSIPGERITIAKGYELDAHYGVPTVEFWKPSKLEVLLEDFTRAKSPSGQTDLFNFIICNPPYVRHHHIPYEEKNRLQQASLAASGVQIGGLAGLYCYFIGLSHPWMQRGAVAGWLVPSEFMDVNYGKAIKQYLLNKVTLIRIHRFDPKEVQFDNALVSSTIVWFRNEPSLPKQPVEFTFGGSLLSPEISRMVQKEALIKEAKWTQFPAVGIPTENHGCHLSDLFTINRGIATGANKFFILTKDQINKYDLPRDLFRPILPSPRYLPTNEINQNPDGLPDIDLQLFLLDCCLSETEVQSKFPKLWEYLQKGKDALSERYLCRSRKIWYSQEERDPPPILCTYLGRGDTKNGRPFRFILNHSQAIAANVYLLLYPKPFLKRAIENDRSILRRIWEILNNLNPDSILKEGRVYGGGLHKLEPKELGNIDANSILDHIPELRNSDSLSKQCQLNFV